MSEYSRIYLQMIQEPISRMSTTSAIFKGFSATIAAGVSTSSFSETKLWALVASSLLVLSFATLDIYYLMLEKKLRFLFDQVRSGEHAIDFSMEPTSNPAEIRKAKARIWDCIKSPSICLFYPLIIMILIIVSVLKVIGRA